MRAARLAIDRTSPTDLMQLTSEVPGSPMQVAAIFVLGDASALDLTAVRDATGSASARCRGYDNA